MEVFSFEQEVAMSDIYNDLCDAVDNHLDWLLRLKYVLATGEFTIQDKFVKGLVNSVIKQAKVTASTCRNVEEFEKKL